MSEHTDRQRLHHLSQARDELLELLMQEEELADQEQVPAIGIGVDVGPAPLSFAQQRLWFFEQSEPGSPVYNVPCAFRLRGPLHVDILHKSIQRIIQRHASLRTTFIMVDGVPQQHIEEALTLQIPEEDLRHLAGERQQEVMLQRASQEAREGFDVERGPLLRGLLFLLASDHHILLLTFHHSIFDGWSRELFLQELCALYEAYLADTEPQLVELPLQYTDFARWQRQHLDEEQTRTRLQAYWRQQLEELPVLEFPTDRPRPARQTYDGETFSFTVPQALYHALQALSRRENVTLFMTVLAAFQVLLARYTAQDDIVIGTPIANRNRAELEHLIGFFVNMLVIRTHIEVDADFLTLLRRIRETVLDAYAHQDFPFERLVEMLRPERDASRSPLFQVVCILQNLLPTQRSCANLTITPVKVPLGVSKFDLTLELVEAEGELTGFIEYNTALFNAQTIRRLAGHWLTLLEGIVQNPHRPLHSLPMLTADERQQILYDWNAPEREQPPTRPFHELFSEQAERTPDAVAISCEQGVVTYQALERYANQLARYLCAHGVTAESPVGVYLERTPAAIISILGIFKAGGCYVPLDPATPRDRLEYMLQAAGIEVLLTQRKLLTTLPAQVTHSIAVDARWADITHEGWCSLDNRVGLHHLAYIIFTSGTTGRPKGVLIEHRGLVNLAYTQQRIFGVGPEARVLQFAPLSFDASIWEICFALLSSATLVLPPVDLPLIGQALWQTLRNNAISVVTLPPSILAYLPEEPLLDLQTLIVAGEACPAALAERWGNGRRFFNAYGPTEATVCATVDEYRPGSPITIGRPIPHTQIYLLDPYLQPVPVGIPGEIYIAGVGLARGYIGGANERFLPHPFVGTLLADQLSAPMMNRAPTMNRGATGREGGVVDRHFKQRFTASEPGARLYRTGDLARYTTDGSIEYLGRVDQQVKIRGFRVEPGEVESLLMRHPAISQCLVRAHVRAPGDTVLLAYIVPFITDGLSAPTLKRAPTMNQGATGREGGVGNLNSKLRSEVAQQATNLDSELRAYLQDKVPGYMLPSDFVYLSWLPLNTHGKVDHRALPVPALREREQASEETYVAPRTPLEQLIAECWQEVLHLNQVSLHDNFFDLGGHSLLAVRIQQRLQQALQRPINLIDLFTYTTVSSLAQALNTPEGVLCPPPYPTQSKRTEQAAQIDEQRRLRTRSRTVKE